VASGDEYRAGKKHKVGVAKQMFIEKEVR
jgi:hypothetical protein